MALLPATNFSRHTTGARQAAVARNIVCRSKVLHGEHGHGDHTVPWFKKQTELWLELTTAEELQAAQKNLSTGKMLVVDYYAGWCAVCKTAYPAMCRLAVNQELQQHYVFAKASLDCPDVKDWVKQEGIRGIPHIAVYEQSGAKLLGMGASFKKAETIKSNLKVIAANKDIVSGQGELMLDPNFFVILPSAQVAA